MLETGRFVHVPSEVAPSALEHTSQPPEHAALQQKLSAQKPEKHWFEPVHAVAMPSLGTQALLLQ